MYLSIRSYSVLWKYQDNVEYYCGEIVVLCHSSVKNAF